ncbi:MAG: DAK2 domain-containing protein [Oscillospiraceae bacterium]|nr:DAK2 domain-containing protein [Oscillospiraceae bacterium]
MITGSMLRDAFISASNCISNNKKSIDELNVFPVPDGDTGTNMSMTLSNAKKELELMADDVTVAQVAKVMASGLLRGARGNSGVITSLLFKGFDKALSGQETADIELMTQSLEKGVERAYKAVMKPTEGTILTVARLASVKARELAGTETDLVSYWEQVCVEAERVLDTTPDLLPTLKKAGVVDAGGKGLCMIFRAMLQVFKGEGIVADETQKKQVEAVTIETYASVVGSFEDEIHYTYCTEYIVKKDSKTEGSALKLRAYLESIGDCVVVVEDDEIIKVHVHTNNPGLAIEKGLEFGSMNLPKIENMRYQHEAKKDDKKKVTVSSSNKVYKSVPPEKDYGFVAVATGEGIEAMFKDAGADCIVRGGQTMNPSTEDILAAIQSTPARTVFVLPNNKNIIMAAEQAVKLADRKVCVLQTRTIPQGLSALLAFDPTADYNTNSTEMTKAFERVQTGQVTFAARDSEFDGVEIHEGEILAMDNGKLSLVEKDAVKAAYRLTKRLIRPDSEFISVIYGKDVKESEAEALRAKLEEKFGSRLDINVINGGQPVYYYIISVE